MKRRMEGRFWVGWDCRAIQGVVAASLAVCAYHNPATASMRQGDLYVGAGGGVIATYKQYNHSSMWTGRLQHVLSPSLAVVFEGGTSDLKPIYGAPRARLNMIDLEVRGFARSKHAFHPVAGVGVGPIHAPDQSKLGLAIHAALGFAMETGPTMVCLQGSYHGAPIGGLPGQDQYIRVTGLFSARVRHR